MFKVLVVDDEIWMCEGLKIIVSKLGLNYTVADVAADGREALRKLQNEHFDVVITDINMPNMNGLELMEKMKAGGYNQPVIIISAYHEFEYARSALRLGAVDYLIKPIKNDELSSVLTNLQDLIERERQQSAQDAPLEKLQGLESGAELIENMLRLIEQSYMEDLSLSLIADQAGYNSSYLSRLFKLETGKGFVQYLREVRMRHACRLLVETNLTNVEVAKQVGFWDEKHFRRTFKKDFNVTPGEYREQQRSKKTTPIK